MGVGRTLLVVAAIAVAGCGGSGQDREPERFGLQPSQRCFKALEGVEVTARKLDFVASTALGGGMRVRLPSNFVVLAFGEDPVEAERIERAYRRFAGKSIPIDDVLERTKNVVLVWNAPPSPEERTTIMGCLRGPG